MKKIRLTQGFVFALFLSFTACTPSKYYTYLEGRWQPVKLETPGIQQFSVADDSTMRQPSLYNVEVLTQIKHAIVEQKQKGVTVEDLERQIQKASMESQSTFTFYPHGVGIRETPGDDPVKGSWKLKKFGKLLIYTEMGSTQSIRLDIDTLTMTKMMVHTANLPKGMILTYIKQ